MPRCRGYPRLADEPPFRAELLSITQLGRHARTLAASHQVAPRKGPDRLLPRLDDNERALAESYALVAEAVSRGRQITPAAEWFLDNYHLIQEQIRLARRHLPRNYSRELPRLVGGLAAPRVYDLAIELISHAHGRVDLELVTAYITAYQSVTPLQLGELWAIPIMLRLALIENLRRVVAGVAAGRRDREGAAEWAARLLDGAETDRSQVVLVLARMISAAPALTHPFVSELASRLQGQGPASVFPLAWLDQQLADRGQTVAHSFQLASQSQAADQVSIGNSIGSLRFLAATDWREFVELTSVVERTLRTDPAGVYPTMDFATRDRYRHVIEGIARAGGRAELAVAERAIALAGAQPAPRLHHVGYFLVDRGLRVLVAAMARRPRDLPVLDRSRHRSRLPVYVGAIAAIATAATAGTVAIAGGLDRVQAAAPLAVQIAGLIAAALCASQLGIACVNWACTMLVLPRLLPRLDLATGIPAAHRTLVAVPTMLTSAGVIDDLVAALEVRFLANRDANLGYALVGDVRDAAEEHLPTDAALVQRAADAIAALNAKYRDATRGGGFFLLQRARRWNPREGVWMGWERKRGKLDDLNATLRGATDRFATVVGPVERLAGVAYVIVLDSDTELPRDAARGLVGTLGHPLNRAIFDPELGRVIEGYSILQPRVGISMESTSASRFARLFAGESGIDPYTRAVSDVYQDVFGEGSFIGKGIYDVDAVLTSLGGVLPENRVLSHDLLEGAYGRAGLVSDVILYEDFPAAVSADASRRARWIRGDWQIARWLLRSVPSASGRRRRNPISRLSQWKIFDNLRRGLVPIAMVALLGVAWAAPSLAVAAVILVGATLVVPGVLGVAAAVGHRPDEVPRFEHMAETLGRLVQHVLRELFTLATLPYEALLAATSIGRATWRVLVGRRKLLQWRTAADAQRAARTNLAAIYASMWILPASGLATAMLLALRQLEPVWLAAPVGALWLLAPAVVWWLDQPLRIAPPHLDAGDQRFLRVLARRTWSYFDTYAVAGDHDLPPDNVQEDPPVGVAHRTSPTNIGLGLLATLAAYDFGYVTLSGVIDRTTRTLATLASLPRYRGHFYNWYDTRTLEPLRPMYVSTVDSGNLAGHLLVLASGLHELAGHRIVRRELFAGLADGLDLVAQSGADATLLAPARALLADTPSTLSAIRARLATLATLVGELAAHLHLQPTDPSEAAVWVDALTTQVERARQELDELAPWLALGDLPPELARQLDAIPSLAELARLDADALPPAASAELRAAVRLATEHAATRLAALRELAARSDELADHDYDLLYDKARHLLAIGYNATDRRLDASYYDLLASEARLASFVGIAQGKLPQEHWFHLGRLLTTTRGRPALLSWSGSMFEYLMPLLVMPTYPGTLLDGTNHAAVARQIEHGRERGVPWGVSESGYYKFDVQQNYQYRAFGVPGLGFKRGLADDVVIAPYACVMALMVEPDQACANLRRLAADDRIGMHGFYEAVDYTPSRLPTDKPSITIKSYMAHHQGMALLSLAYTLLDRPMQRRWNLDPALRATDLLLQERVPRAPSVFPHPAEVSEVRTLASDATDDMRVFTTPDTPAPEVHLLSNGRYHVAFTNAGAGYSRCDNLAVTRWQEDSTRDCWGTFLYLRDVKSGSFWSAGHQPTLRPATHYEAVFSQGRAELRRRDEEISTHVEISVCPEDDLELRRVTLSNVGKTKRTIEITSYAEVVLAPPAADSAHRTFSNLFVQTELVPERQAILATRRARAVSESPPWLLHLMTVHGATTRTTTYETDRAAFIGRNRSLADPLAMHVDALGNSAGAVLDPIVAIRTTIELAPDESVQLHIATGVAEDRARALALLDKYSDRHLADRVLELAWTHSQVVRRRLEASNADAQLWERLAGYVIYLNPALRAPRTVLAANRLGQSGLWAYGISGDLPIVLLRVTSSEHIDLVRQLVRAHAYWRLKGLVVDLVVWNEDPSGYRQNVHEQIMAIIAAVGDTALIDKNGGIFVRRSDQMSEADAVLIQTLARAILSDTAGTLAEQVERRARGDVPLPPLTVRDRKRERREPVGPIRPTPPIERPDLLAYNGHGGFTRDGREYVIVTQAGSRTPAPWVNVLANSYFGSVVSETGSAYSWCENANAYRLTPWTNDPVTDPSGEALYLRDDDDGSVWSPTPLPATGSAPYTTRHGFGYSVFETTEGGLASELTVYVALDAPVKFHVLKLTNRSGRTRRISLTAMFELVLGSQRAASLPHVVTEVDVKTGALFATNPYSGEFAPRVAFLECSEENRFVSGDRQELIGRNGQLARPAALARSRLSGRVGAGLDPCLAMQVPLELADGQERQVVILFGSGRDLNDARHIVGRVRGTAMARESLEAVWAYWNRTLGTVHVETPDPTLNFLANGWLVYQIMASRLWGRSGFYQSGGAYGFRDQLQDTTALLHAAPELLREQIVRCASRQFPQGDVQHWWHPPLGRGVRTRISDDYLWLPYAVCRYVNAIGDTGLLEESVEFIEGRPVNVDEESYYDLPVRSSEMAPVYEHCKRSIQHGLRLGVHGLPLMGTGDWNDGMNLVGEHGKGESVWLAFFLHDVLAQFGTLARKRGDVAYADECVVHAAALRSAIEANAWDGGWYRRAYFDDGTPLGSAGNAECQIDSLPQSWAVLSGAGDPARARAGLAAVNERLVDRKLGVIKLFDPPFEKGPLERGAEAASAWPGYVGGYVPGVRENGGQYTHAAVWTVMAFAAAGDVERAWELFGLINPVRHGDSPAAIAKYLVEPYVVAADVYTNPSHAGRGGWTWYTGSAGWMYRLVLESLLGIHLEVDHLRFEPLLPAAWPGFDVRYRHHETMHNIRVNNLGGGGRTIAKVVFDGQERTDHRIPLLDDGGEHWAVIDVTP